MSDFLDRAQDYADGREPLQWEESVQWRAGDLLADEDGAVFFVIEDAEGRLHAITPDGISWGLESIRGGRPLVRFTRTGEARVPIPHAASPLKVQDAVRDLLDVVDEQRAEIAQWAEQAGYAASDWGVERKRAELAEAERDELRAKLDELTSDPTLCTGCGCTNDKWAEACTCDRDGCGCAEMQP